jgi:ferric-dicitrate binding protein FerR (iron transport regulator)
MTSVIPTLDTGVLAVDLEEGAAAVAVEEGAAVVDLEEGAAEVDLEEGAAVVVVDLEVSGAAGPFIDQKLVRTGNQNEN